MKLRNYVASPGRAKALRLLLALLPLVFCVAPQTAAAQVAAEARREQLLNGLKIILVHRPDDSQVVLKLRVHSGSAFDLAGKEGMTALLGDALFADPVTREYVTQELDGRLEVETGFDSIEVTLSGPAKDFERLVELLRNALVNTQLSPDAVGRLRAARIKTFNETSLASAPVADRAIAARLFGEYPYGRRVTGTPESLARVDRADLLLARERFLNPNNATLVATRRRRPRARDAYFSAVPRHLAQERPHRARHFPPARAARFANAGSRHAGSNGSGNQARRARPVALRSRHRGCHVARVNRPRTLARGHASNSRTALRSSVTKRTRSAACSR